MLCQVKIFRNFQKSTFHLVDELKKLPLLQRKFRIYSTSPSPLPHQYLSFYKYATIKDPEEACADFKSRMTTLGGLGRVYFAREGVNAQFSVPTICFDAFKFTFEEFRKKYTLGEVRLNIGPVASMEHEKDRPFEKLTVKTRQRIVADSLPNYIDESLFLNRIDDISLTPKDWHEKIMKGKLEQIGTHSSSVSGNTIEENISETGSKPLVIDCRNYYESQIGIFEGAERLPIDRYADSFEAIDKLLLSKDVQPDSPSQDVLLYCTGGIRCEKIGAYLTQVKKHKNVFTLQGGINQYAKYIKENQLKSAFKGKNYQFDKRNNHGLEVEAVTDDTIANCFSCGTSVDHMRNCVNPVCNILMVQCDSCHKKMYGACSKECEQYVHSSQEEKKAYEKQHELLSAQIGSLQKFVRSKAFLNDVLGKESPTEYRNEVAQSESFVPRVHRESQLQSSSIRSGSLSSKSASNNDQEQVQLNASFSKYAYKNLKGRDKLAADNVYRIDGSVRVTPRDVQLYSEMWTSPISSSLSKILKENCNVPRSAMSVGPYAGQFLKFLAKITKAKNVLEIGTFFGYSALCMAEGIPTDGKIVSVDLDDKSLEIAKQNIAAHPEGHKIELVWKSGKEYFEEVALKKNTNIVHNEQQSTAGNSPTTFDLIFIDADKHNFLNYYNSIFDHHLLSKDGVLIVDNTLWRGEVADHLQLETFDDPKPKTKVMHTFNTSIHDDPRTAQVLLPVRDGITMITWADNGGI